MATAGSLVINVSADAAQMEKGFAQARAKSRDFASSTLMDLKRIDKEANRFGKTLGGLSDAKSIGNLLGTAAGGTIGGFAGGLISDFVVKQAEAFWQSAERGTKVIVEALKKADEIGARLEGIDLVAANQVRNADSAWKAAFGPEDNDVRNAQLVAPLKEAFAGGVVEMQQRLSEAAKGMQAVWEKIPGAIRGAIPGAEGMAAAMQKAADLGKEIADNSREHAEATARAAQLQAQINQRAFKPVAAEADAGLQWLKEAGALAQMTVDAAQEERARRAFSQRVMAEQGRLDKMPPDIAGSTGALMAGSSAEFSATQKAQRIVEAQAAAGREDRSTAKVAEKMLKAEEEQVKKLDKVIDELKDLPRVKVFKIGP